MNEKMNYRGSAIDKIIRTKKVLSSLTEKHSEDKTLKMFEKNIINRMEMVSDQFLKSWYKDGIENDYSAEVIEEGKACCISQIDALELLVVDIEREYAEGC
jgi:hypothetical protein